MYNYHDNLYAGSGIGFYLNNRVLLSKALSRDRLPDNENYDAVSVGE